MSNAIDKYVQILDSLRNPTPEQVHLVACLQSHNVEVTDFVARVVKACGANSRAKGTIKSNVHLASALAEVPIPRYARIVLCIATKRFFAPKSSVIQRAITDSILASLCVDNKVCTSIRQKLDREWHKTTNDEDALELEVAMILTESWQDAVDYKHILGYISRLTAMVSWHAASKELNTNQGKDAAKLYVSVASGVHNELSESVAADDIKTCYKKTRKLPFYKGNHNGTA